MVWTSHLDKFKVLGSAYLKLNSKVGKGNGLDNFIKLTLQPKKIHKWIGQQAGSR
jgi:hypothetical protein